MRKYLSYPQLYIHIHTHANTCQKLCNLLWKRKQAVQIEYQQQELTAHFASHQDDHPPQERIQDR